MKKFSFKLIAFFVFNLAAQWALLAAVQSRMRFENWETEAVYLTIPEGRRYDLAFMGTSHGKTFSRAGNHQLVESILGKTMFNLSKGKGTGVLPGRLFLERFYERGNRADHLVYFIDAWAMSTPKWNEENFYLTDEPFEPGILLSSARAGISPSVLGNYYKSKFDVGGWFQMKPDTGREGRSGVIDDNSPEIVAKYIKTLYPDGFDEAVFARYAREVAATVELAQAHGTRVTFVLYPTLLGKEPGLPALMELLVQLRKRYGTAFYDHSKAVARHQHFYNSHHLNRNGTTNYAKRSLIPIVSPGN